MKNFAPNFLTKVVTTLAILPILAAPAPAKAADNCHYGDGFRICGEFVAREGNFSGWSVDYTTNTESEKMEVICEGKELVEFKSKGTLTQEGATLLAEGWCSL